MPTLRVLMPLPGALSPSTSPNYYPSEAREAPCSLESSVGQGSRKKWPYLIQFSLLLSLLQPRQLPCYSLNPVGTHHWYRPFFLQVPMWVIPISPWCLHSNVTILLKPSLDILPKITNLIPPWHFPSFCPAYLLIFLSVITVQYSTYFTYFLSDKGEQNMPSQNMCLWHKNYFELVIFEKSRHRRISENSL